MSRYLDDLENRTDHLETKISNPGSQTMPTHILNTLTESLNTQINSFNIQVNDLNILTKCLATRTDYLHALRAK